MSSTRTHKRSKTQCDSQTGVNPKRTHGLGIWGNRRVVMGVRVDEELKKQFVLVSKRVFGSVCNPIESFMATVVACQKSGVNFGTTIDVGKIVITRDLKVRRKLVVEETVTETRTVADVKKDKKAEELNRTFANAADQWDVHSVEWQHDWIERARKHPELSNSALVLALEKAGDS
jgi:hypothetical protein